MGWTWTERLEDVSPAEWQSVLARSARPSPFLSPLFLRPWARSFAAGGDGRFGIWDRDGRAEGFLFLCRCGGKEWELLGGGEVADALDAPVTAGLEAPFWAEALRESKDLLGEAPIRLPNLVEGSPSLSVLPEVCRSSGLVYAVEAVERSPYVPLPESFDAYLRRLGGKDRHELRRKMRRAAEAVPGLSFRVTGTPEELARDFPSFARLHRLSHPEKRLFMDDRMEAFFREVAEGFLAAGRLRLAFLSGAGGDDLAAAFQIEWDGALLLYNSGFDPGRRNAVPGLVLIARCLEDAIGRGLREYDFLRGTERYKYDLGGRDRVVYRAAIRLP